MNELKDIFCCTRCGYCCHGNTTVSLDQDDQQRMKEFLGLSSDKMNEKYLRISGGIVQMKTRNNHCVFYDDGCKVHLARPKLCRQWPLHLSILKEPVNLETIKSSCPGINKDVSYQDFCKVMNRIIEE